MKKYLLLTVITASFVISGCEKFLEESSQNLLKPTTTEQLAQTLLGEGYPFGTSFHSYIDMITDDVTANYIDNEAHIAVLNKWAPAFLWKNTIFEDLSNASVFGTDSYAAYYRKIKGCNVVMDNLVNVTGSESEKNKVKAEALFLRSFYFFNLVNLYAKPIGSLGSNPDSDLGIPLVLSSDVTRNTIQRANIRAVYTQIEIDLNQAYNLFLTTPTNIYHPGKGAAALLLSRVYLYEKKWDEAADFAEKALAKNATLKNLNDVPATPPAGFSNASPYYQIANGLISPEVIWNYGDYSDYSNTPLGIGIVALAKTPFAVSSSLSDLYDQSDRRGILYFSYSGELVGSNVNWFKNRGIKFNPNNGVTPKAFRVAEAYLNRAEANIQKALNGDMTALAIALADINKLRAARITTANYQDINISDPATLYTFYQQERRRELCFEDQRWFDIRRWGLFVTHTLQLNNANTETVTLEPGNVRFTMPIPQSALTNNPELIPNP